MGEKEIWEISLFTAIAGYVNGTNQLAIQGVDYYADAQGFLARGDQDGANTLFVLFPIYIFEE